MSEEVWYWREGTTQHGPITWEKLQSLAESGKIAPNDWVTREGWIEWKLACEASEVNAEKAADTALDVSAAGEPGDPLPPLPPPVPLPIPVQAPVQVEAPMPVEAPVPMQAPVPVQVPQPLPELVVMTSAAETAAPNGGGVQGAALPGSAPLAGAPDGGVAQGMVSGAVAPVNFASVVPDGMFSTAPTGAAVSLPLPLPVPITLLPPLQPGETLADPGPPPPSPDGVGAGEVQQLQRVLRDGGIHEAPKQKWNYYAVGALAAAILGLLALAFEMGLVAIGLGGYCLYVASVSGDNNGRKLALTAMGIGALNVVFRVLCATTDLGLTHM